MSAAIYLRKSNDEGDGSNAATKSIAVQREIAERFITARGWTLDPQYVFTDDGISGVEFEKRAGLQAMLKASAKFNVVVVTEQSRLGRDTVKTLNVIEALEEWSGSCLGAERARLELSIVALQGENAGRNAAVSRERAGSQTNLIAP